MLLTKEDLKHFKDLLKSMDFNDEDIKYELQNLIYYIKSLPEVFKIYRIIYADDISDINKDILGSHYSTNKKELINSHSYTTGYGDNKYLFTVEANKEMIDFVETISNNILYPNENEITLKNKGKGVKIISVKKLN